MNDKNSIQPGRYRHYKGNEYTVVGTAQHSETLEELVVYRKEYGDRAAGAFDGLDLLITPTLRFVAPAARSDDLDIRDEMIRFTYPFNVLGWPALAAPCGSAERGLPASVQLVGRLGDDARVIAAGTLLETALSSII